MLLNAVLSITIVWVSSTGGSTLSPNVYRSYTPPIVNLTSCVDEVAVFTIQNMRSGGLIYLRTTTGVRKVESSFDTNGDIYTYQCSFDDCGIQWFVKFTFVSQRHTVIQTSYDMHLTFLCLADLMNIMPGGGATKDTDTEETLRHYYRAEASMTFYDPDGMEHETGGFVKLGTPMDIYINLTNNIEDMFDVTVRSCSVILLPIIEDRCAVDGELFGAFTRMAVGLWYNNFSMFRPTSTAAGPIDVFFSCTLEVCRNPCPSYFCNDTEAVLIQTDTTRRKRQAEPSTSSRSLRLGTVFRVAYEEPIRIEPDAGCMDTSTLVAVFTSFGVLLIGSTTSLLYYITEWNRKCQFDNESHTKIDKPKDKIASNINMTYQATNPVESSDILNHKNVQALNQLVMGTFTKNANQNDNTDKIVTISKTFDKPQNYLTIKQTKTLQIQSKISTTIDNAGTKEYDVRNLLQNQTLNNYKCPQIPETPMTVACSGIPTMSPEQQGFRDDRGGFATGFDTCNHPQNINKPQTESPNKPARHASYAIESKQSTNKPQINSSNKLARPASYAVEPKHSTNKQQVNSPNQLARQASYAMEPKQSTNKPQVNSPNQLARQASYAIEPKQSTNKPQVNSPNQLARQASYAMEQKQSTNKPQVNSPNQLARQAIYEMEPKQSTNKPQVNSPNKLARQASYAMEPKQSPNEPQVNSPNQSDRHVGYAIKSKQNTKITKVNSPNQLARQESYAMESRQNTNKQNVNTTNQPASQARYAMEFKFPNNGSLHTDEITRKRSASEAIAREIITLHARSSSLKHHAPDRIAHEPKYRYAQMSTRHSELTASPQLQNNVKKYFGKRSARNVCSHETKKRVYSESEVCDTQ